MSLKRIMMLNMSGDDVKLLQTKLKDYGFYTGRLDGIFGQNLLISVTNFQKEVNIRPDGIVGNQTWNQLSLYAKKVIKLNEKPHEEKMSNKKNDIPNTISYVGQDGLIIYNNLLNEEEYYKEETKKNTIWLHHTAGGSRPDWTIGGWENDYQRDASGDAKVDKNGNKIPLKVGTHFVIGRKSSSTGDKLWDGKILKAIDERYWSYHLGISKNSKKLNSESVSIEICNYGPLTFREGKFFNWVNKPINNEDVVELSNPFRGYQFWEKYTDAQLESTRKLILHIQSIWNIKLDKGIYDEDWFNYDEKWFTTGGLRSHTQVRKDKFDIFPQPELIQMLNSL